MEQFLPVNHPALRRIGPAPETLFSGTTVNLDDPKIILISDIAHDPFVRGNIVYPCILEPSRINPERPGHAFIKSNGDADIRFLKWKDGDDLVSLAILLEKAHALDICAELQGTGLGFYQKGSPIEGDTAIAQLLDFYFENRFSSQFQLSPSQIVDVRKEELNGSKVVLCSNKDELEYRIQGFIGLDRDEPWLQDWRESLLNWNSDRYFELEVSEFTLRCMRHNEIFSITVLGGAHDWSDLENHFGEISEDRRSTHWVQGKLFPESNETGLSMIDFKAALLNSPYDWELAAKIAARDIVGESRGILLNGDLGMYSVHLYIGHYGEDRFAGHRWRHSNGQIVISPGPTAARSYLSVSVQQFGAAPAGSREMINELIGIRDDVLERFKKSHHSS